MSVTEQRTRYHDGAGRDLRFEQILRSGRELRTKLCAYRQVRPTSEAVTARMRLDISRAYPPDK